jgi:hypothetical protein
MGGRGEPSRSNGTMHLSRGERSEANEMSFRVRGGSNKVGTL